MTEEQIKNLKEGDKFTIEFTVKVNEVGNFLIAEARGKAYVPEYGCVGLRAAKLVAPPPTFEVGDTVRIIRDPLTGHVHGRENWTWDKDKNYVGEIQSIDVNNCQATVYRETSHGWATTAISLHCLELVKKAVKDKYCAREYEEAWVVEPVCRDEREAVSAFYKKQHPNAKAAAEAECARLNAEWRKQQKGGAE